MCFWRRHFFSFSQVVQMVQIRKDLSEAQEARLFDNRIRLGMTSHFPSKWKWDCVKESSGIEE
jgi:hypothetical protein